jgi:hypothetical protein
MKMSMHVLGITGLLALSVAGCATKPTAAISSQSEAVCIGSNLDRDVIETQRELGRTVILSNADLSDWSYPAY